MFFLCMISFSYYLYIDQVDAESSKELEQWNEMLRNDAVKLCQDNNFNTGFFEGSDNNCVIDAYELKVIFILESYILFTVDFVMGRAGGI